MRKRGRNAAHFILLLLLTALVLLAANLAAFLGLFAQWREDIPFSPQNIMENLTEDGDEYALAEDVRASMKARGMFAMMISLDGHILWREGVPAELERTYTIQDVARFARYYLDDYPVHTFVIPEGLLVIGSGRHTTWKYTLEFNEGMVRQLVRQTPLILLANVVVLIAVPLFIQKKWLCEREEARTEWIAGVSHDIRTPLTLILGSADAIRRRTDDELLAGKAEAIESCGLRIRDLVSNLNTSSKLDYGMGDFSKTPVRICAIVRTTAAEFMNRDSEGRYPISLSIGDDLRDMTVTANAALFKRMLENLIGNAVAHNPGGCSINICLEADKANAMALEISDNGRGASAETIDALHRRGNSKKNKLGEHGTGLRLVKQIARYHSWKIVFFNHAPKGFACRITMKART